MQFREQTLANGLEVIAEINPDAHSLAMGFFVKAGARDESTDVAGVSHFLEHMVFKGTPSRTPDDVNREFDEMGAHYNAFTSEESTVYYGAVLPEFQHRTVALLGDILRPSLREEDFNTEKQVIIEEIRMYADQPPFGADERCRALHYGKHPLGHSVLGTVESITALPVDAMRQYFKQRYSPSNIVLAATGRVDYEALLRSAEEVCGSWEPVAAPRFIAAAKPEPHFEVMHKESATQAYVMQLADGPSAEDPDRFAAKLCATILGDDSGSRLYWELVDSGLADNANLSHYDYLGSGIFMSYLSCDPDDAEDNTQRMVDIFREAMKNGVTEAELNQAKSKISARLVLGSERPRGRLFAVGGNWSSRREYRSVADDLKIVDAVTVAEIAAVLAKYPLDRCTTLTVGPRANVAAPV